MAVYSPGTEPQITGWIASRRDDGTYYAQVLEPLTEYQGRKGCQPTVYADTRLELERLCLAHEAFRALVAVAEQAREVDAP